MSSRKLRWVNGKWRKKGNTPYKRYKSKNEIINLKANIVWI